MIDNYYVDLARFTLAEAETKLVSAQKYLRDAGTPDELQFTQHTIDKIRKQIDRLALLPSNNAVPADREST